MDIKSIIDLTRPASEIINNLKAKTIIVPSWDKLVKEYNPDNHPVMDKVSYPDLEDDKVTRITYDLQRLATKRMTELCFGVPVKRVYNVQDDKQQQVADYIEAILQRNRIDSFNIERGNMLYAGCEVLTIWYAIATPTTVYGFDSALKLRCRNFSPMLGDELYPLFDEYGDMIAMSIQYKRKVADEDITYFDCYTAEKHLKFSTQKEGWQIVENEEIQIGKIPAIYIYRPEPIWGDTSKIVDEIEMTMSRAGNYLRKNSKPILAVFTDENVKYGDELSQDQEFRTVVQYSQGSSMQYVTWQQATESLKFYITELRETFFSQLQLPDWSYDKMKTTPMSGEARKQLFIDCQLKVKDESGRLLEFFDREINVVKSFLKKMVSGLDDVIDSLQVETVITPFTITDEKDTISNLVTANGGKPIMSQRESIAYFGKSSNVDKTMKEINEETSVSEDFELTV